MGAVTIIKQALQRVLPALNTSNGSIESKIIDVVGAYADSEAVERRNTLNEINNALANQKVTTVEYYRRKAIEFQLGGILVYDPINQGGYYESVSTTQQIVKQAYIVGGFPNYSLLVNKIGNDGHLTTLSSGELASFKTYFDAFQPLGLHLNIASLDVAKIYDPDIVIYVRAGSNATEVADQINANLIAHEQVLRKTNTVSLSEIEDVIQQQPDVLAVGFSDPKAVEVNLAGEEQEVKPIKGLFSLTNGAFIFGTTITPSMIKVLQ